MEEKTKKIQFRGKDYFVDLFNETGLEFSRECLMKKAKDVDYVHDFPERAQTNLTQWVSGIFKKLEEHPDVAAVLRDSSGRFYVSAKLISVDAAAEILGRKEEKAAPKTKKAETKKEEKAMTPTSRVIITEEDKHAVAFKALRYAVRFSRGGEIAKIQTDKVREACMHNEQFPELSEILSAFRELKIQVPVVDGNDVVFKGHCLGLKKVCEAGKEKFPGLTFFNFEKATEPYTENAKDTINKEEHSAAVKSVVIPSASPAVFTDEENFKIFLMGGYLMEHGNASVRELSSALEKEGRGMNISRLEVLIHSVPQFVTDDYEVYLKMGKTDPKTFWSDFRKVYRPMTGEREQIICNLRMSEKEVIGHLEGCQVALVDEHSDGFNTFRIDVPKNSIVARYNFMDFMRLFREGEKIYTQSKFVDSLIAKKKKKDSAWKLQDALYRYETGFFEKRGV